MTFTVLAIVFISFAWSRAFLRFRDRSINFSELVFWSVIWFSAIVIILWPGLSFTVATYLGINRGADVVIYTSIVMLFYLVFRLYIKISSVDHEITRLVRALAIKEKKKQ